MIRLELQGGLGNQLFIWAMAHKLSEDFNRHVRIVYPLSKNNRIDRSCELSGLMASCGHDISISNSRLLSYLTKFIDKINSSSLLAKIINFESLGIITKQSSTDVNISSGTSPKIIRGFFQNTQMVTEVSKEIGSELLSFVDSIALPKEINMPDSRGVAHIRRGDTRDISREWGLLSLDYYLQNLGKETSSIICTDESSDLKKFHEQFPLALIMTTRETNPWQTLKILSSAEKLVMANSSLSWWAGWIASQRETACVIFPNPWRPVKSEENTQLILPTAILAPSIFERSI